MVKITRRERVSLIIWAFAVGGILIFIFLIRPLLSKWHFLQEEIPRLEQELDKRSLLAGTADRYRKKVENLRKEVESFRSQLLSGETVSAVSASFLQELEGMASEAGIEITRKNTVPGREKDFYRSVRVQLTVQGELESLVRYLYGIEAASSVYYVSRLTIRPSGKRMRADMVVEGFMAL